MALIRRLGLPLHNAASFGHPDIVEILLDQGADVDARKPFKSDVCRGETPLHSAIFLIGEESKRLKVIDILLSAGSDLSMETGGGWRSMTPFQYAEDYMKTVRYGYNESEKDRARSIETMKKIIFTLKAHVE
jgi:hypothetical protein